CHCFLHKLPNQKTKENRKISISLLSLFFQTIIKAKFLSTNQQLALQIECLGLSSLLIQKVYHYSMLHKKQVETLHFGQLSHLHIHTVSPHPQNLGLLTVLLRLFRENAFPDVLESCHTYCYLLRWK